MYFNEYNFIASVQQINRRLSIILQSLLIHKFHMVIGALVCMAMPAGNAKSE